MHSNDSSVAAGGGPAISRRMLLKSGVGALAAASSLGAVPAWASRGAGARIDEAAPARLHVRDKRLHAPHRGSARTPARTRRGRPAQVRRRHDRKPLLGPRRRPRDLDRRGPRAIGQGPWATARCSPAAGSARRLDRIRSVDPSNPHASGSGLAIAKRRALYGHGGSIPGFQSFAAYDPARRHTLVI
jgi:hypothetical protein